MPELLTKHPEIVLEILKEAKIKCGDNAPQKILKDCPPSQFCSLPTGELCIYGTKDISAMSQLGVADFLFTPVNAIFFIIVLIAVFTLGMSAGHKR